MSNTIFLSTLNLNVSQNNAKFLDSLLGNGILDASTLSMVNIMVGVATALIFIFMALKIGYEYFRYSLNSVNDRSYAGKIFDINEVARLVLLGILLTLYVPLIQSFIGMFDAFNRKTEFPTTILADTRELLNKKALNDYQAILNENGEVEYISPDNERLTQKEVEELENIKLEDGSGRWSSMTNFFKMLFDAPFKLWEIAIDGLFVLVFQLMSVTLKMYTVTVLKVIIAVGPLAILASVFWKDKFMTWFNVFINTGLVFITLNMLDYITLTNLFDNVVSTIAQADRKYTLAYNIAMLGAYLSVFKITSLFAGSSLAGGIISKGLSFVGLIAGAAVGGAIGGGMGAKAGKAASGED